VLRRQLDQQTLEMMRGAMACHICEGTATRSDLPLRRGAIALLELRVKRELRVRRDVLCLHMFRS
jgi:hypothetical protein